MKTKTKKLITRKDGQVKHLYANAIYNCRIEGNKLYPKYWGHKGGSLIDNSRWILEVLEAQGYKYSLGNDAPRGGKSGDFIKVSKVAMNFLLKVKNKDF